MLSLCRTAATILCAGLAGMALAPSAKATEWDKKTRVTFNVPVEIPGRVIGPGTYIFQLLDDPANRDVVQIFNQGGTHLVATILAIPDYRMSATGKTVFQMDERKAGTPEAIHAWFYPGDLVGEEFAYHS